MDITLQNTADQALDAFLAEWHAPQPYVSAHTSGSTGTPKHIRLLKADMLVSATATCRFFGLSGSSHLVMPLSADYIAGKMMVVRAMVADARLTVVRPSRDLSGVASIDGQIDLLPIVPAQLDSLLRLPNLPDIKNIIIGGAPLTLQQEQSIADAGICAYATYGMTETCSHVALRRIGHEEAFMAMPGISFGVDADDCLIINAPQYSQRQFCTNDVVRLIDNTHFVWLGRRDNVINSGGIKIMPEEVEVRLRPYLPDIDFYITSRKSHIWGEELIMIVATQGKDLDLSDALSTARLHLPHHLIPKDIILVTAHTYTATGKLIRLKVN